MTDIATVVDQLPPWMLVVVVAVVMLGYLARALAEWSETWAKILGPFGTRRRGNRRATREAADMRILKRQVGNLATEVDRLNRFEQQIRLYLVYDADWHFRARLTAAQTGTQLPDHMSFTEWEVRTP